MHLTKRLMSLLMPLTMRSNILPNEPYYTMEYLLDGYRCLKTIMRVFTANLSLNLPQVTGTNIRGVFLQAVPCQLFYFWQASNIIIEYTLVTSAPSFVMSSKVSLPLIRAFMDDMNLMSSSVSGAQNLLECCTTALKWAQMEFCTKKSRSFVIVKGRSLNTTPFSVYKPTDSTDFSSFIPSIHSEPIRFLGRIIDGSISDRKAIDELEKKLLDGLTILDKSCFKGPQKLWIHATPFDPQNSVVPSNI